MTKRHVWTVSEENLAISLYKSNATGKQIREAVKTTDLKLSSLKMKLSNIKFLDTGFGLPNVSTLTRILFAQTNNLTQTAPSVNIITGGK